MPGVMTVASAAPVWVLLSLLAIQCKAHGPNQLPQQQQQQQQFAVAPMPPAASVTPGTPGSPATPGVGGFTHHPMGPHEHVNGPPPATPMPNAWQQQNQPGVIFGMPLVPHTGADRAAPLGAGGPQSVGLGGGVAGLQAGVQPATELHQALM